MRSSPWRRASWSCIRGARSPRVRLRKSDATRRCAAPISEGSRRMPMLEVEVINSFYGDSHVLFDISMHVEEHEVVALLGRNGAGKTTTLKTIAGVLSPRSGSIRLAGKPIHGL